MQILILPYARRRGRRSNILGVPNMAVKAGHQHRRECQVSVAGRIRCAELDPFGTWVRRIHWNPAAGGTIALRIDQINWRLITGHQPTVGVRSRCTKRAQRRSVFEQATDVMAGKITQVGVVAVAVEQVGVAVPQALQLACICRLRILRRTVIANNAVTASRTATMMNTEVQLPVVCLRNAAAGPPKIEPTPCAI